MDGGKLDHDLVRALLADLRLRDAELVDAVPHDVDGPVDVFGREHVPSWRLCFEHDLEATLEVEALTERAVSRGAGHRDERDAHESREQKPDEY
jgi:hypothetical protein